MEEIWKEIDGFDGDYMVSNLGRVKSVRRNIILRQSIRNGYERVTLCANNSQKDYYIHRLVAHAFIPNPNNYPIVNHKDENRTNNRVDNLEWCTRKYNASYGTRNIRTAIKQSKKVYQYDMEGNLLEIFPSCISVQRKLGYKQGTISSCCLGKIKSYKGFIFKYEKNVVKHKKISKKD